MDIAPASLPQIQKGRRGRVVFVDHDALDIAKRLKELSPDLRLAWNEFGNYFVVYQILHGPDGKETEHLVTTWDPEKNGAPDARLIERIRKIMNPDYDYAGELERINREADKQRDHEFSEQIGARSERLFHALQKDLGVKPKIFVPDVFPKGIQ